MPSTPLGVLVERRKVALEAAEKIREGEALCVKAVDVVVIICGALLEDDIAEKIQQSA